MREEFSGRCRIPRTTLLGLSQSSHESTIAFDQQRRLFEAGLFYHPDQKARFLFEAPRDLPEPPDKEYPFLLLTGRGTSSQWHTQTRTGKIRCAQKALSGPGLR